jgi:hypothetical protein
MVEINRIRCNERIRTRAIALDPEVNGWVRARPEIEGCALEHLLRRADEGIAVVLLGLALGFTAGEGTRVGGVGAEVMLHGAGALDRGAGVHIGAAVHREGASGSGGEDNGWGRNAAEGAGEGLNVVAGGGSSGGGSGGSDGGGGGGGTNGGWGRDHGGDAGDCGCGGDGGYGWGSHGHHHGHGDWCWAGAARNGSGSGSNGGDR